MNLFGATEPEAAQRAALRGGQIPVAVYGLGKMGLPLASVIADVTGAVIGSDVDQTVVDSINLGTCHVDGEPGLPELVRDLVARDALIAVDEPRRAAHQAVVHVIIVPTLIDEDLDPDLSILESVAAAIGPELTPGEMVIVESTVPPGTCTDLVRPVLEETSSLTTEQFGLAFCPERTSSGRALEDIRGAYPKVVGGINGESTRVARLIYEEINARGVIPVADATTAEAVKVFEGVYRDVNIALANELALFADELKIDVNEAIDVANTLPFCDIHAPGPGVGGHCIPYYPYFLFKHRSTPAPLLETARRVNDSMPAFTVRKLEALLDEEAVGLADAEVLLLGLTYRPGVNETRASPAVAIAELLVTRGAKVFAVDPVLDDFDPFPATPLDLDEIYTQAFDAVLSITPHREFDAVRWNEIQTDAGRLTVIDCRNTLDLTTTPHRVYTIGSGRRQTEPLLPGSVR